MEGKTVWISRTREGAAESAKAFEAAGFNTVLAPLITVRPVGAPDLPPKNAVLIFTSQNGVRTFCDTTQKRDWPVVTVGDATAELARAQGFTAVYSAAGTSADIAPLIARGAQGGAFDDGAFDKAASFVHICNQTPRGTVVADLRALGLSAARQIYYRSEAVEELPKLDWDTIDVTALFSPRAAQVLTRFAPEISPDFSRVTTLSISAATDRALDGKGADGLSPKARLIAAAPTVESMIAALRASV